MFEAVINVSEGRDLDAIDQLKEACGRAMLDVHRDADHHRSVFTLASPSIDKVNVAARALTTAAIGLFDLRSHQGVHPRIGVVDVVPFVALDPRQAEVARAAALAFGSWAGTELGVPVFFYDEASTPRRSLPAVRRGAFSECAPDVGPSEPHVTAGAMAVGARQPMVAINLLTDLAPGQARSVAETVRESSGGVRGVRALAFETPALGGVQISMNLVDLPATSTEDACEAVRARVERRGGRVMDIELVGLTPRSERARWSDAFKHRSQIGDEYTVEGRYELQADSR